MRCEYCLGSHNNRESCPSRKNAPQPKKSKIDLSDNDVCSCEAMPGEEKWEYKGDSEDGMTSKYCCRFCKKEVLV